MKKMFVCAMVGMMVMGAGAQTGRELPFQKWASTPPMGWNSWDCYGPTVVEDEVKSNADYMAEKLAAYGWEYVVVDIRWFVENDKAGGYNQTDPIYVYDEYGRYTPALNRFPSAAGGVGFRALADYIHSKGLKFGIHLMRGLPKIAAEKKLPVKGTNGITCDMIASNDSACTWLRDNYKVDYRKPGAQEYYNSCFEMYAEWGVDFVKIDDLSRPYHTAEIEMIRKAIDRCGRDIVLSISPGETPLDRVDHVKTHANMWRTVDDFWDNWSQLNYQFQVCAKWAPYIAPGTWPDADMLPLGKISIRGERGAERWTNFTRDEQYTMMNLWTIFKSPLMFGGDLPQNDKATDSLLTNRDVLYMHHYSVNNRQLDRKDNRIIWTADDAGSGDKYVALFNTGGSDFVNTKDALYRSGTISYLTTGYAKDADVDLSGMKSGQLALVVTDDGDGYDCDHADWIEPTVTLKDGSVIRLTERNYLRGTCGWGSIGVNQNINGGKLSINGIQYDNGLAVHANSVVLFDVPADAVRFTARVGIDNTGTDQGSKSSVEFMVFDGDPTMREETTDRWSGGNVTLKIDPCKQAACSGFISRNTAQTRQVEADVTGVRKLYLVVTNGGDGLSYDHADWAAPVLVDKDGKEFSLTETPWEPNPVNGWNTPKLNKNNEGNAMTMDGRVYEKGFGVNAPSMLTFVLPEGHEYVTFKSIVGYDDDVKNAESGVTMEFRVFTEDPTPDATCSVPLDLTALGFAADQPCRVTEMWKGTDMGVFKNGGFAPVLRSHASGLYRISAVERAAGASVSLDLPEGELASGEPFDIKITVAGASSEGTYVQMLCNDKIIGVLPLGADGTAVYTASLYGGEHKLQARYGGTTTVSSVESDIYEISVKGVSEDLTVLQRRLQSLVDEARTIVPEQVVGVTRVPLEDAIVKALPVEGKSKAELEACAAVLQEAMDAARLSMPSMAALWTEAEKALDFLALVGESEIRTLLQTTVEEGKVCYAAATSTVGDVEEARGRLSAMLATAKKEAQPVKGKYFDMTEFLVNPSFEAGTKGWKLNKQTTGWESFDTWSDRPAHDGSSFVSLAFGGITSIDLYQTVDGLPAGVYSLQGALRNTDGKDRLTDQHIYAQTAAGIKDSDCLTEVSGENNNDWSDFTVTGVVLGEDEALRLGARSSGTGTTAGWFQADDFRLFYWGLDPVAVRGVRGHENRVTVSLREDGVHVSASSACRLSVYTVGGMLCEVWTLDAGEQIRKRPCGQYVINGKLVVVR